MNYLIYIELAAENLQFFLWYKDYVRRFELLPENERRLVPVWTAEQAEAQASAMKDNPAQIKTTNPQNAAIFKGTDFSAPKATVVEMGKGNPFNTPPMTPNTGEQDGVAPSEYLWSDNASTVRSTYKAPYDKKAAGAFDAADIKLQPCKSSPN